MKKKRKVIRILERILNDIVVCLSLVPHLNRYKIYKSLEVVVGFVLLEEKKMGFSIKKHKNGYELPFLYFCRFTLLLDATLL